MTGEPLVMTPAEALNPVTGARYPVVDGIPRLFVPTEGLGQGQDVTEIVKDSTSRRRSRTMMTWIIIGPFWRRPAAGCLPGC